MPSTRTPSCGGCSSRKENGANWVKKCTYCCKQYCNVCSSSGCPHCGKYGEDWTQKVVSTEEWDRNGGQ